MLFAAPGPQQGLFRLSEKFTAFYWSSCNRVLKHLYCEEQFTVFKNIIEFAGRYCGRLRSESVANSKVPRSPWRPLFQWYFYVRQRDKPEEWKCQPHKWLSPDLERHEILLGSSTLLVNVTCSAFMACYISNGGYSTVYYDFFEYPIWWLFLQVPVIFVYQVSIRPPLGRWRAVPYNSPLVCANAGTL